MFADTHMSLTCKHKARLKKLSTNKQVFHITNTIKSIIAVIRFIAQSPEVDDLGTITDK